MRYFYEEQQRRLEAMGEEVVSLEELLNEFNDMIAPAQPSRFRLAELQRCGLAGTQCALGADQCPQVCGVGGPRVRKGRGARVQLARHARLGPLRR